MILGCKEEQEKIKANIWFFNSEFSEIYRDLNNGDQEFIKCNDPTIEKYISFNKKKFEDYAKYCRDKCTKETRNVENN